VTYEQPNDSIGWSGRILNPRGLPMLHTDKFYMPNNTRVDYVFGQAAAPQRAFVITSTCTPISAFETHVYTLISYRFGWFNWIARWFLPFYTHKVIAQDVEIMQVQGTALKHRPPAFRNTQADRLHEFIESLREHAATGATGPAPEPRTDRIEFWI
jgi:hypothetical protein